MGELKKAKYMIVAYLIEIFRIRVVDEKNDSFPHIF